MDKVILKDGDEVEVDFCMFLHEFYKIDYGLVDTAYIDGRAIDTRSTDRDNVDRRWFEIMRTGVNYDVGADGWRSYSGDEVVYVRLFDASFWQRHIDERQKLLSEYGTEGESHGG